MESYHWHRGKLDPVKNPDVSGCTMLVTPAQDLSMKANTQTGVWGQESRRYQKGISSGYQDRMLPKQGKCQECGGEGLTHQGWTENAETSGNKRKQAHLAPGAIQLIHMGEFLPQPLMI
ncbi:hypothetical protein Bbelb_302470 [Branchiostoma belcheri]|nr:hypothetical protein Bbelb_302470 [Branchiostoma belcheri]